MNADDQKLQNETMIAKSEAINALVNTMEVNKRSLGIYYDLRDLCYEKLMAIIKSL